MRLHTDVPSPATMAPSQEAIAASGVDWSTATGVAAVVESPVALPDAVVDDAAGVVLEDVPVVSVALLQAASDTERARARAAVVSFFMEGSLLADEVSCPQILPRCPLAEAAAPGTD